MPEIAMTSQFWGVVAVGCNGAYCAEIFISVALRLIHDVKAVLEYGSVPIVSAHQKPILLSF